MLRRMIQISLVAALLIASGAGIGQAQSIARDYDQVDYDRVKVDRYLDAEVWVDHSDGEYYQGDNIIIYFRVNRDAFVSIYSIDTRGRVNLLFPTDATEDNYIFGGVTYSLPGSEDDYDLAVTGPEGFENIQIIASRERFPIPNWYRNSGLVADWDDRDDYMDYLNYTHFVRYGGQRFAFDRAAIYVNEWEPYYYRPVYYPYYPSWTIYGNSYIDYPYGASIYVDGLYWGIAPLYIPRIAVGWHTITIYDYHHHCWESDFHVSRHNTVVFNQTIVRPTATVRSKYKEVRLVGYRDPVESGYPKFKRDKIAVAALSNSQSGTVAKSTRAKNGSVTRPVADQPVKKYVRGSAKMIRTDRGYETDASTAIVTAKKRSAESEWGNRNRAADVSKGKSSRTRATGTTDRQSVSKRSGASQGGKAAAGSREVHKGKSRTSESGASGYYQKKSGSSTQRKGTVTSRQGRKPAKSGKSVQARPKKSSTSKSGSSTVKKRSGSQKSSSSSKTVQPKSSSKPPSGNRVKSSGKKAPGSSSGSRSGGKTTSKSGGKGKKRR